MGGNRQNFRTIPLINSTRVAIVDEKDYYHLIQFEWKLNKKGYAKAGGGIGLMHRYILRDKLRRNPKLTVHHRNNRNGCSNKLDNRRGQMEVLTEEEHKLRHMR